MAQSLRVKLDKNHLGEVLVDGKSIHCSAIRLELRAMEPAKLEVEIYPGEIDIQAEDTHVVVSDRKPRTPAENVALTTRLRLIEALKTPEGQKLILDALDKWLEV